MSPSPPPTADSAAEKKTTNEEDSPSMAAAVVKKKEEPEAVPAEEEQVDQPEEEGCDTKPGEPNKSDEPSSKKADDGEEDSKKVNEEESKKSDDKMATALEVKVVDAATDGNSATKQPQQQASPPTMSPPPGYSASPNGRGGPPFPPHYAAYPPPPQHFYPYHFAGHPPPQHPPPPSSKGGPSQGTQKQQPPVAHSNNTNSKGMPPPQFGWHPQYGPPPPHMMYPPPPPHAYYQAHHPMMGPPPPGLSSADGTKKEKGDGKLGVEVHTASGGNNNKNVKKVPRGSDPTSSSSTNNNDDDDTKMKDSSTTPKERGEEESSSKTPQDKKDESVTKDKLNKEANTINPATTPATCNETLSTISPSAFMNSADFKGSQAGSSLGGPTPINIYSLDPTNGLPTPYGKPIYYQGMSPPHGSSPYHSIGSFSAITKAPLSASHYFASAHKPLPGSSGGRGMHPHGLMGPPPPGYSPQVYQYQHFDPRSHVDHPMPPTKVRSSYAAAGAAEGGSSTGFYGIVPPTVHMPSAVGSSEVLLDPNGISPLNNTFSAVKNGESKTPAKLLSRDGSGKDLPSKESPLDLLSAVSGSPSALAGSVLHQPHLPISHMSYTYPTPHGSGESTTTATPSKKTMSSSLVGLLSAANTLDIDESKRAKKRKLSEGDVKDVKKELLKKSSSSTSQQFFYTDGTNASSKGLSKSQAKKVLDSTSIEQARQATLLAEQAMERPRIGKQLLLSMALVRTNPRTPPSCYPAHGTVLTDRFHWASYPPLDTILRKNMKRYYELSTNKCQSRDQQEFNNALVIMIRKEAQKYGWEFDEKVFDDKKIRDRIRCFYKTHIQNAKKRLKTMLKNPEKRANIKALAAHFHLIEEKGQEREDMNCNESSDDDDRDSLGMGLSQSYSTESERLPSTGYQHKGISFASPKKKRKKKGNDSTATEV